MMERHHVEKELEVIEFAGTVTIFDPENSEAWLCIAYGGETRNPFQKK